jgi:protein-tyrosine-phosphatase
MKNPNLDMTYSIGSNAGTKVDAVLWWEMKKKNDRGGYSMKKLFHLVFVCMGNRNRSAFAEFFFFKLISEKNNELVNKVKVTSAGFLPQRMKDRLAALQIGVPDPFFSRSLARTTRAALLDQGITVSDGWRTKALTTEMIEEADLVITALPEQKKDLVGLYPKAAAKIFAMREISQWDGYLVQEDYDFKGVPWDSTIWDYVEENPEYVSKILSEMEKMLIKGYTNILSQLGLKAAE